MTKADFTSMRPIDVAVNAFSCVQVGRYRCDDAMMCLGIRFKQLRTISVYLFCDRDAKEKDSSPKLIKAAGFVMHVPTDG